MAMSLTFIVQSTFVTAVCEKDSTLRRRSSSDFWVQYPADAAAFSCHTTSVEDEAASEYTVPGGSGRPSQVSSDGNSELPFHDEHTEIQASGSDSLEAVEGTHRRKRRSTKGLLASNLAALEGYDHRCILIVKRINRLGFNAAVTLEQHYARYGAVAEVLLSNVQEKDASFSARQRLRPSSMGWLRFEGVGAAAQALMAGEEQDVNGALIVVRAFKHKASLSQ